MMDAVEYLRTVKRMCATMTGCHLCPLRHNGDVGSCAYWCELSDSLIPEDAVQAVETWAKTHPVKTNGKVVLDMIGEHGSPIIGSYLNKVTVAVDKDWWDEEVIDCGELSHDRRCE